MEIDIQRIFGSVLLFLLATLFSTLEVTAKRDKSLFCGACLALVEEMNYAIARIDRKKTIQVGSFRIDAQGNVDAREIPYARSDVHLTEEFENICRQMYNYGLSKKTSGKKKLYIRKYSADGTMVSSDSADFEEEIKAQLQRTCYQILEDFDEELMPFFKDKNLDLEKAICVEHLGFCKEKYVQARMWAQAEAVMAGMKEQADEARREAEGEGGETEGEENVEFEEPSEDDLATEESPIPDDSIFMRDGDIPGNDSEDREEL